MNSGYFLILGLLEGFIQVSVYIFSFSVLEVKSYLPISGFRTLSSIDPESLRVVLGTREEKLEAVGLV